MSLSDGTPMMTMPVAPASGGNSGGFGWGGAAHGSLFSSSFLLSLAGAVTATAAAWSTATC